MGKLYRVFTVEANRPAASINMVWADVLPRALSPARTLLPRNPKGKNLFAVSGARQFVTCSHRVVSLPPFMKTPRVMPPEPVHFDEPPESRGHRHPLNHGGGFGKVATSDMRAKKIQRLRRQSFAS